MASSPDYSAELALALRTVHRASLLTKSVLRSLKNSVDAETKADDSPVTVADFAAQALIIAALHAVFPADGFIGEESAGQLRADDALAERVWGLVASAGEARSSDVQTQPELAVPASKEQMLEVIDLGAKEPRREGRTWVLDPVDGTATFMEGKQYAVCLCLMVDGVQEVGVIGCPNLQFNVHGPLGQTKMHEDHVDETGHGVVLSAVKGHGTYVRAMQASGFGEARRITHDLGTKKEASTLDFVESTLGKTSLSQDEHRAVAETFGARWPGTVIWSQQLKYVALALGATDVMLRLPKTRERYTHVWDHAGGQLIFQEAGGIVRDIDGKEIDLGQGRVIRGDVNFGMVAALPAAFDGLMRAVRDVLAKRTR